MHHPNTFTNVVALKTKLEMHVLRVFPGYSVRAILHKCMTISYREPAIVYAITHSLLKLHGCLLDNIRIILIVSCWGVRNCHLTEFSVFLLFTIHTTHTHNTYTEY